MSVSSVGSTASVSLHGQDVPLEVALRNTVRDIQKHLNLVECHMIGIAAVLDQDDDYAAELDYLGKIDDELREMTWLFDDLRGFATELISEPEDNEERALLKKWKTTRKELEKKLQIEHAAHIREEKAASKLARKLEKARLGESKMEE